ncbi:hypothetical protein OUZ56_016760 [Daphnia magna]|uniref:Uncharacterized protein n=1 Tax=Daphnia magna TaxID=35525 RepID=A0ABR0ARG7_9CRUS|nr:hypothetical protein OUZ56_016760 [Daphnia magna]
MQMLIGLIRRWNVHPVGFGYKALPAMRCCIAIVRYVWFTVDLTQLMSEEKCLSVDMAAYEEGACGIE